MTFDEAVDSGIADFCRREAPPPLADVLNRTRPGVARLACVGAFAIACVVAFVSLAAAAVFVALQAGGDDARSDVLPERWLIVSAFAYIVGVGVVVALLVYFRGYSRGAVERAAIRALAWAAVTAPASVDDAMPADVSALRRKPRYARAVAVFQRRLDEHRRRVVTDVAWNRPRAKALAKQ